MRGAMHTPLPPFVLTALVFAVPQALAQPAAPATPPPHQTAAAPQPAPAPTSPPATAAPAPQAAAAATPAPQPWKFSGLMFGDYYGFADDHDPKWDGQQGFWFRRIYFTFDYTFNPRLMTRLRLEANSNGTLANTNLTAYVKDAYLRWTLGGQHQLFLGIQQTPTFEFLESVWGLRHIEKAPADLYRIDTARDFGIGLQGPIAGSTALRYAVEFGNDSGQNSEVDANKGVRAAVRFDRNPGLFVEGAYAFLDRPNDQDRQIVQLFGGFRAPRGRVGLMYLYQQRQAGSVANATGLDLDVYSGFAVWDLVPKKWTLFGRVDRFDDPNPDGPRIDYLPLSALAPFTLTIAGVDWALYGTLRLSPNVEWVTYGDPTSGPDLDDDVIVRATFFWSW